VSWRAIGCGTLAAGVFVLVGLIAIWRAGPTPGCPAELVYPDFTYQPAGSPADEPRLEGVEASLEPGFRTSAGGFTTWTVWVEPDQVPSASGDQLPDRMVLECGDGTFQAFLREGG
jgi:hypothetical protein